MARAQAKRGVTHQPAVGSVALVFYVTHGGCGAADDVRWVLECLQVKPVVATGQREVAGRETYHSPFVQHIGNRPSGTASPAISRSQSESS